MLNLLKQLDRAALGNEVSQIKSAAFGGPRKSSEIWAKRYWKSMQEHARAWKTAKEHAGRLINQFAIESYDSIWLNFVREIPLDRFWQAIS